MISAFSIPMKTVNSKSVACVMVGTKISELEPPTGYSITEATQEVYIKSGTSKVLTFENIPLSALVVWKYDSVTGAAVSNAVFQVKYLTGTSGTGGTIIGIYKTSANGSFTVTGLKEGTYIVEELASDSGHVIDSAPQTVYISGKQQDVVQLYFGNSPKGSLLVKKIDSVTHEPLSDVEFMVTTADGTVVGDANGKFVTDSAGSFTVSGITPGTVLVVKKPAPRRATCWTMHRRPRPSRRARPSHWSLETSRKALSSSISCPAQIRKHRWRVCCSKSPIPMAAM